MDRLNIGEVAERLDRRPNTVRGWERDGILPPDLIPHRDEKGYRYWTESQVAGLAQWIIDADMRPGKGLAHYKPTPEQAAAHIRKTRASKIKKDELRPTA
jgi:hypothetical protein